MKIINFQRYKDGGTDELTIEDGTKYCFDGRIRSQTKNKLYLGYPKNDNSNLIEDSENLKKELINALKDYKNDFYKISIDYLINNYE
jgi:hypothetical protein